MSIKSSVREREREHVCVFVCQRTFPGRVAVPKVSVWLSVCVPGAEKTPANLGHPRKPTLHIWTYKRDLISFLPATYCNNTFHICPSQRLYTYRNSASKSDTFTIL